MSDELHRRVLQTVPDSDESSVGEGSEYNPTQGSIETAMDDELAPGPSSSRLNRPAPTVSKISTPYVYKFFTKFDHDGRTGAECKCGKKYLSIHIDRMVKHAIDCLAINEEERIKLRQMHYGTETKGTPRVSPEISEEVNDCLVKAVAFMGLPLRIFDQSDFRRAFELINYKKLPHSDKVSEYLLPRLSNRCRDLMMKELDAAEEYSITIEFDSWQDINKHHITGVTAITRLNKVYLLKLVDDSIVSPTGVRIAEIITNTVEEFINPSKINSIVSDEASNCRVARNLMVKKEGYRGALHFRCFAHVLNLVGKQAAASASLKKVLEAAESIVKFVNHRQVLRAILESQNGYSKLVSDVSTRWYTTRKKVTSLLKNKFYMDKVMHDHGGSIFEENEDSIRDNGFWSDLQEIADLYDPLCELIAYSEGLESSLSRAFEKFLHFGMRIYNERNKKFRPAAFDAFLIHFSRLDLDLLFTCLACNPSCEGKLLTAEALTLVKQKLIAIARTMTDDAKAIFATVDEFKVFWNTRSKSYDLPKEVSSESQFKIIAQRLSNLHPSSANTERIFSSLKHVQTDKKSRMTLNTLEDIIRVKMDDINKMRESKQPKRSRASNQSRASTQSTSAEVANIDEYYSDDEREHARVSTLTSAPQHCTFFKYISNTTEISSSSSSAGPSSQEMSDEDLFKLYERKRN